MYHEFKGVVAYAVIFCKRGYTGYIMKNMKSTKLTIREDRPTAIGSSAHKSNLNVIGFNITFLAPRNPKLAVEVLKLYDRAIKVSQNDPLVPDEDFDLFSDELTKMNKSK